MSFAVSTYRLQDMVCITQTALLLVPKLCAISEQRACGVMYMAVLWALLLLV